MLSIYCIPRVASLQLCAAFFHLDRFLLLPWAGCYSGHGCSTRMCRLTQCPGRSSRLPLRASFSNDLRCWDAVEPRESGLPGRLTGCLCCRRCLYYHRCGLHARGVMGRLFAFRLPMATRSRRHHGQQWGSLHADKRRRSVCSRPLLGCWEVSIHRF
jgi:hypothetical protein